MPCTPPGVPPGLLTPHQKNRDIMETLKLDARASIIVSYHHPAHARARILPS